MLKRRGLLAVLGSLFLPAKIFGKTKEKDYIISDGEMIDRIFNHIHNVKLIDKNGDTFIGMDTDSPLLNTLTNHAKAVSEHGYWRKKEKHGQEIIVKDSFANRPYKISDYNLIMFCVPNSDRLYDSHYEYWLRDDSGWRQII